MKTVVVISFSPLNRDPRVNRQIRFLNEHYRVTAIGLSDPQIEGVHFLPVKKRPKNVIQKPFAAGTLLIKQYENYYWPLPHIKTTLQYLQSLQSDLILANDIDALPVALKGANKAKVIFDAHEYFPRQFEDRFLERILFMAFKRYLCYTYIPKADGMMTVCQGIAKQYEKDVGVKPVIVTNAPDYHSLEPNLKSLENKTIKIIHHGEANPSRKIENMIAVMDHLDNRFTLDFLLVPMASQYITKLKNLANPNSNIRFLPSVPMQSLVSVSHEYDIGLFSLPPTSFSYLHALPNKFFEFIQARLMVAIGPSPEMAQIVKQYNCGVVANDFSPETLAAELIKLDHEQINYHKQQSHKIAYQMSAEQNKEVLLDLVDQTLRQ